MIPDMKANYHTHTFRCKHADGEDKEYVEAAIKAGIKTLGFSDHCPWIYDDDFVSKIRMLPDEVDDYCRSLEMLREEYKKDIRILIGFEAEYLPALVEKQDAFLKDYPIDYMILGQHFLEHELFPYTGTETQDESVLKKYVDTVIEGLDSGRYLYLAHPDLINYQGFLEIYAKHMLRLCHYLKEHNIPIEINMLGKYQGRHYPRTEFLALAGQVGNSAIIGVDAHTPRHLQNHHVYELCVELAQKYHLKLVDEMI